MQFPPYNPGLQGSEDDAAVERLILELLLRGVWLVITRDRGEQLKVPLWSRYLERRPGLKAVMEAWRNGRGLGWVPASVGLVVLDVDYGTAPTKYEPLAKYRTARGEHLLFELPGDLTELRTRKVGEKQSDWWWGELISAGQHCALRDTDAMLQLFLALTERDSHSERRTLPLVLLGIDEREGPPEPSPSPETVRTRTTHRQSVARSQTPPLQSERIRGAAAALAASPGQSLRVQIDEETAAISCATEQASSGRCTDAGRSVDRNNNDRPTPGRMQKRLSEYVHRRPDDVQYGERNLWLFANLMLDWAPQHVERYRAAGDREAWDAAVAREASRRVRMLEAAGLAPETASQIAATVRSVAKRGWSGKNARVRASPEVQAARGKRSGVARRAKCAARDAEILKLREKGLTQRAIADRVSLSQRGVCQALKRLGQSARSKKKVFEH